MVEEKMNREINKTIWEKLYGNGRNVLTYPNEVLVTLASRMLDSKTQVRLLDYGFGSGNNMMHFLKRGFEVSGVEISEQALELSKKRAQDCGYEVELRLLSDGTIPFSDNSFDIVVAWQVLCYNDWNTLRLAVNEIERVLKPGGVFLGTMTDLGDISHIESVEIGDHLYRSQVKGQDGAIRIIVNKDDLQRCFPKRKLEIGKFGHEFQGISGKHWIVSYRNE
ncbi:class I SAM-dependent methyltransferase [Anaeroarcus burkinensis]|uniref:class I SAM-dependent methyltransferase n=1 Tax=Anaeroarcus burkinensis TaxID=82376 RepID=UPI00042502A4|nr:class I SAM-dependent methyltransferase [Anaeroarcus burkinensis]